MTLSRPSHRARGGHDLLVRARQRAVPCIMPDMVPDTPPRRGRRLGFQMKSLRARLMRQIRKTPTAGQHLVRRIPAGMRWLGRKTGLLVRLIWPRVRSALPLVIGAGGVVATVWAIAHLHTLMRSSPDAWASAISAVTTVALVLITAWYAYVTSRMLDAQRSAPRAAAQETALRELLRFMASNHTVIWRAAGFFPVDVSARPPMVLDILGSRDGLVRRREHMLEVEGLLPRRFAASALFLAAALVDAEQELHALAGALLDETMVGLDEQRSWTWEGARKAHEDSRDPERSGAWQDILQGKQVLDAQGKWDDLYGDLGAYLMR